jgi:hypothetical protein
LRNSTWNFWKGWLLTGSGVLGAAVGKALGPADKFCQYPVFVAFFNWLMNSSTFLIKPGPAPKSNCNKNVDTVTKNDTI